MSPKILPGPVFRYPVFYVMGSNPQLEQGEIELTSAAETGGLYMHNPDYNDALQLIPLLTLITEPLPAAYFYSRLDGPSTRFIAYHSTQFSEIDSNSEILKQVLSEFSGSNSQ